MKNRAFRKFVASIGVAAMVMSTATNALSPAVTKAESAQELEGQQNDSQEQGGQEDPVAQSSDDASGAPFADAESMAVSSEDSQNSQEAAGPSESSDTNGENGAEGSSGENTNASAGSTSTDASGAESQGAAGTMSGATNGTSANGTSANTSTDAANGTSADASTGMTTGENGEASGDNAEASTKEITSVITEDIDLGTYSAGEAPAYAQLELPDEIEVKVDEEKQIVTVTWNGEETYHPDQAGTYIFSSELDKEWNKDENGNARYQLAEKVELPKASVRVEKKAESKEENKTDVKSDNKTENKTDAKLDNKTDSKTDAKADNKKDSKTDAKADSKPEGKTEEKSDSKSEVTTKPETTKDTSKETAKDTSKETAKETSKKDSTSKDKTKDETKGETKDKTKDETKAETKTDTKDESAKADQKKVTNAASLKAVYVAEDGTILCGTVGLTGDSFTISDKVKSFNGYELKTVTLGEEELPQDTAFTRNTSTTETKEEIRTEASYTYTMDGAEHEIAAGDTATITFTYAQKEEVTPEIASIEVTGEAVDTTGAAIQGDYAFPLAVGTNDLSKTAPYIQGYEYQYAEIGTDKITSIAKEVLEAGKYAYYVDGELLKENTRITYVYQEDEDYTKLLTGTCGNLTVTVSAKKDAKIPEGTIVRVSPIEFARMSQIMAKISETLGQDPDNVIGVLYDISLDKDGEEIQPKESVHVTMKFDGGIPWNVPEGKQIADTKVVHMHGGETDVVAEAAEDGNAEFETESFSTYGMIRICKNENANAGTENLENLLTSANLYLDGKDPVTGEWNVKPNKDYKISLEFAETPNSSDKQFHTSGRLYYQLPEGVQISEKQEGKRNIHVEDANGKFDLPYTYAIDTNGRITITLESENKNYDRFLSCGNASLYIDFSAQFTKTDNNKVHFGKVEKTVKVDDTASLEIEKKGTYDPATSKMNYEVVVTSTGYNTNVEVSDSIVGSMLTFGGIGSEMFHVDSSRDDNSLGDMTLNQKENGAGFNAIIPSMKDGEVVTIRYFASVDLSKLEAGKDGNTKDETGNEVTVKSDQEKSKSQEVHHSVSAYTSINKNSGKIDKVIEEKTTDGQKKYYRIIPWTIDYNEKRYVSVAGNKIIDEIKSTNPSMEYSGDGIRVTVDKGNGTKETRNISWKEIEKTDTGWMYIIPATDDGNYSYEITYDTRVDVTELIKSKSVTNEVRDDKGHSSEKETEVGPREENIIGIEKTGTINGDQADWTITIKVPANGLTEAVLTDTLPKSWNQSIDHYLGNLNVTGAPQGTSFEVKLIDISDQETSDIKKAAKVQVIFFQNEEKTKPGIAGNGENLTDVKVTLSTEFNPDWDSNLRTHENKVSFQGLETSCRLTPEKKEITKYAQNRNPINLKSKKTAVQSYQFYVDFEGVTGDTLSFEDSFDTRYLKLMRYTDSDECQHTDVNVVYQFDEKTNWWDGSCIARESQEQSYFTTTENGFKFSYSGLPHDKEKNPKNKFRVGYILYIDPDQVNNLNASAATNKGEYTFTNSAKSEGFGSAETTFKYKHATLTKTYQLKKENENNPTSAIAHFTITANPDHLAINNGKNLTLTDTMGANLSLFYSTVKVVPEDALVEQHRDGQTISFTIKDETPVQITYDARITKPASVNSSDWVPFSNTAELNGEQVTSSGSVQLWSASGGQAKNYYIQVVKVNSSNESQKLPGAVFGLYMDEETENPVQNKGTPATNATFTTNASGVVTIQGNHDKDGWTLEPGREYYLKELKAPEGYKMDGGVYKFIISSTDQPNYKNCIYCNGDELEIGNARDLDVYNGFKVEFTKTGSDAAHAEKLAGAKFALKYGNQVLAEATSGDDGKVSLEVTGDKAKTVFGEKPEAGTKKTLILEETEAPSGYTKAENVEIEVTSGKKTEENAQKETQTTYSWSVTTSGIPESRKIVNTKKTGADVYKGFKVEFTKTGSDAAHAEKLAGAKFALKYGEQVLAEATSGDDGKVSLEVTGDKAKTFLGEKPEAGTKKTLSLEETKAPSGYTKAGNVEIEVTSGKTTEENAQNETQTTYSWSVTTSGIPESGKIVNQIETYAHLSLTKEWEDDNNRDNKRPSSIKVKLTAKVNGTENTDLSKTETLKAENGWKASWDNLPKYHDGKLVEYTIEEVNIPAGYTKTITGNVTDGFNITNTYTPEKVQVSGSKNWNDDGNAAGTRPGSITIRLYANGSEIGHKTVTEKDGWSWNWTGLNRYDTDHKEIGYTISEDAVDGYTSSISGYNVTNTVNKPQVGSVILTKVDATTGTALAGAVFDLYRANNTKVGTYTTNAGGVLRVDGLTFGDYYFVETKAPEGYALESQRAAFTINATTTVSAPASVRVTNKPVDEKIGVSAAKVWDDENNTDGVRPSSVTFRLFADGVEIGSAQASEANGWTVFFGNLPKTRNGAAISYAVKEDEVGNYYEASYETGLGSDGSYVFTVKNYRETDKHYEERTGSVRGANRNKPSNGGVAGAGRGRGTGDESDMTVYGTVSGASLLALIVWMIARRKRAGKGTK